MKGIRRAGHHQPRVRRRTAHGQLRRREEGDDEREQHGEEPYASDQPHARVSARHAVAADKLGLRVAQADSCGVHHHVHDQIQSHGQGAQQEERHADVVHHDVKRREERHDAALDNQYVELHAVLVGLLEEAGQSTVPGRPQQAAAGARNPRHHARQRTEGHEQSHDVREPSHVVTFESDLEGGEQPRLEVDLVVGGDDGHGQRAQREQSERDQRREEHRPWELRLGFGQFRSVHGVHLHAGEQQQDARQERDVAHARDVGEETRVDVLRGVDVDDLRDAGRNLLQGDFVAAGHPDDRHHDHDDAREHRADQKSLRGDARDGRRAAQGHQRRAPVHRNREQPDVQPVLRQSRNADHVGDRRGGESQYGGIPDDVLNPLQEDRREAQVAVESLLDPGVDAAAAVGEGAAQFGANEGRGNQEEERREENVEEHRQFLLGHHREPAQADDGRSGHQRQLRRGDIFTFCHGG